MKFLKAAAAITAAAMLICSCSSCSQNNDHDSDMTDTNASQTIEAAESETVSSAASVTEISSAAKTTSASVTEKSSQELTSEQTEPATDVSVTEAPATATATAAASSAATLSATAETAIATTAATPAPTETAATAASSEKPVSTVTANWDELDQTQITAAMGMGWNLGNQFESISGGTPSETAYGNPVVKEELIKAVKAQGFNTVRIPISYLSKIGSGPNYTIDSAWLDRIQEVVDYVIDNDMFAIINIHGDGYYTINGAWLLCADSNQDEIKKKYEAVWKQIAERFKDYDEHLIFESMNEVFDNTYGKPKSEGYKNINDYNQIFADTVRKTGGNNTRRWLLIPGWNTNIEYTAGNYGFEIPDDSLCGSDGKRIMISVHYYDPYNFTLDENMNTATLQWGKYAFENYDSWGQEDYVDSQMSLLYKKFVSKGYPVIIGEMGVQDKSYADENFSAFRCYWTEYVVKACKSNGIIPVYWDNGYNGNKGFGVIDRKTIKVTQPELIAAMMRAINSSGNYEIAAPSVN